MTTRFLPSLAKPAGWLPRFLRDESGIAAVEYALVAACVALATIGTLMMLDDALETYFNNLSGNTSP